MRNLLLLSLSASLLLAVGCGSDPDDGGSGSPATLGTPTEICAEYSTHFCGKISSCAPLMLDAFFGGTDGCTNAFSSSCEHGVALDGVALTRASLDSCLDAVDAMTCDAFGGDLEVPDACVFAGTLDDGAVCEDNNQCQSSNCYVADGDCGTCQPGASAVGDSCAQADCPSTLYCDEDGDVCAERDAAGAPCKQGSCVLGQQCVMPDETSDTGTCQPYAAQGAPCNDQGIGQAGCNVLAGLFCNPTSNTCEPIATAALGEACGFIDGALTFCGGGSACGDMDQMTFAGTCVARVAAGESCSDGFQNTCEVGLECTDGVCTAEVFPVCE